MALRAHELLSGGGFRKASTLSAAKPVPLGLGRSASNSGGGRRSHWEVRAFGARFARSVRRTNSAASEGCDRRAVKAPRARFGPALYGSGAAHTKKGARRTALQIAVRIPTAVSPERTLGQRTDAAAMILAGAPGLQKAGARKPFARAVKSSALDYFLIAAVKALCANSPNSFAWD